MRIRNAATVGGTVVVAPVDSEFILALLALGYTLCEEMAYDSAGRLLTTDLRITPERVWRALRAAEAG